jgi:hypothetical protein
LASDKDVKDLWKEFTKKKKIGKNGNIILDEEEE